MEHVYKWFEYIVLTYFFAYNSINLLCLVIARIDIKRKITGMGFADLDIAMNSPFTPPLSIIIPAYNEESSIEESVRSLLNLQFPRFEIIVVNDGSSDKTLEKLRHVFNMKPADINYMERITTATVRGFYQSKDRLPDHVIRFVVVDKENGGRADACNVGINASHCPYFFSTDADSIIDEKALIQTFRSVLDHKDVVAIGGQIAILNGSDIKDGKVVKPRLPKNSVARFQIVEYIRSFTMGRSAFSRMGSVIIISGAFGIFQKELVQKVGGYLTKYLTSKLAHEYTRPAAHTIGEDMELTIRLQRYIHEKKLKKTVAYVPQALCWTEVPESLKNLSKQRNRWQRGLMETLQFHRKMIFNKNYGRIGLFGLPYFFLFEFLGAYVEFLGYVSLPILFYLDVLNYSYAIWLFIFSVVYGILLSVSSIVMSAWAQKTAETDMSGKTLIYFDDLKEIFILILYGILENFGYRQLTVWWRIRGTIDFFRGKQGWDKFERTSFGKEVNNVEKKKYATS